MNFPKPSAERYAGLRYGKALSTNKTTVTRKEIHREKGKRENHGGYGVSRRRENHKVPQGPAKKNIKNL
jgi:hypothetical protein